ncbi:MAG: hypothetical protein ACYDDI_04460 [Candidatus Acidiferrales bacterium]
MAITDPFDALQKQFENEDRSSDPILGCLAQLASDLNLPWLADKALGSITGRLTKNRLERLGLMLDALVSEVRRHESSLQAMLGAEEQRRFDEWFGLVEDGLKKAEQTRAKDRVERIGVILANSLVHIPTPDVNDVEELMRIAVELSDRDVEFVNELVRIQGSIVERGGRIDRFSAWQSWEQGRWGSNPDGQLDSVFSKLESLGLVSRLAPPNNLNIMADIQNRFALLKKELDFVRFAQRQ